MCHKITLLYQFVGPAAYFRLPADIQAQVDKYRDLIVLNNIRRSIYLARYAH